MDVHTSANSSITSIPSLSHASRSLRLIAPEEGQAGLASEIFRKEINGYEFTEDTTCRYSCTLEEQECAGEDISEVGLYDENGDIACIKNFKAKGKDGDMEMTFYLDDVF